MARYFKFKSLDDIRAACDGLGLSIAFSDDLNHLFQPAKVGPLTVGNRLCIQPMEGCDGTLDGRPDELTFRRYRRFGAGGAKLIWAEANAIVPEAQANSRQLIINESTAPYLERMLSECRAAHRGAFGRDDDLIIGLQLTHSGRYSFRKPLIAFHDPILDSQTLVDKETGQCVDESYPLVSDDYLKEVEDHYVRAARLAVKIGFDFVDIKQCHRYLLNELLAAKTRPGPYGGSLENRTRLARNVIARVQAEEPRAVIGTRMNVYDCIPFAKGRETDDGQPCDWAAPVQYAWGTDESDPHRPDLIEPKLWIRRMIDMGVSIFNISMGNPYASMHVIRPFEHPPPDGYETPEHPLVGVARHFDLAGEIQKEFPNTPIVGSGYSYLQEFLFNAGAANIRDGRTTFIGVGRASLSQPDFAKQLMDTGKLDRKRICRTFSYCTALMRAKHNELGQFASGCPPFDKDVYGALWGEVGGGG